MRTKICIDCGIVYEITSMQMAKLRCDECAIIQQRVYALNYYTKRRKKELAKQPFCHCGCGRRKAKGLSFLSSYCYKNTTDEWMDELQSMP